ALNIAGTATWSDSGNLVLDNSFTLNVLAGGTFTATDGQALYLKYGTLTGAGTINADVINHNGTVKPGSGLGTLTIVGNYTQQTYGELDTELGGTADGQYDCLVVTGTATLAGILSITPVKHFVPKVGDRFQVMTFAAVSGDFTSHYYAYYKEVFDLTGTPVSL